MLHYGSKQANPAMPRHTMPLCCGLFLAIVGVSLFMQATASSALARCENRGGSLAYCRLAVYGR